MAVVTSGGFTKHLQRKSHGLANPYDVPLSPPRRRSPPKGNIMPGSIRRLETYGPKGQKAALRPRGKLGKGILSSRQALGDESYGYRHEDRASKRQKSRQNETPTIWRGEEGVSRTESALDDITERARNRLIYMALEGLSASGEISSSTTAVAAPAASQMEERVTWDATTYATIGSANNSAASRVGNHSRGNTPNAVLSHEADSHTPHDNPITINKEGSVPSLEPETISFEDLTNTESNVADLISSHEEPPMLNRTSERGDRNVDIALRASIPYPVPLSFDEPPDAETENNTIESFSKGPGMATDDEAENPPFNYSCGEIDTDEMHNEINNDTRTEWGRIESVQDHRTDETDHVEFLVRWERLDDESTTWVSEETLLSSAPRLMLLYFKVINFGGSRSRQNPRDNQQVTEDQIVEEDQFLGEIQPLGEDPVMGCALVMKGKPRGKTGRGRLRSSRTLKSRMVVPALRGTKKSGVSPLDHSMMQYPSRRLRSSMVSEDASVVATSQLPPSLETPPTFTKRGRGRPRGSGKSKFVARVPRQIATRSMKETQTASLNLETPPTVMQRGRGRPRGSGKSKFVARVPRQITTRSTRSMKETQTSDLSEVIENFEEYPGVLTRRQNRLSGNCYRPLRGNFLMPTSREILKAAKELDWSRTNLKDCALVTQSRQGRPEGSQNRAVLTSSDQPAHNPYKKQFITGESNRGLKLPPATYSVFAKPPRRISGFSMPAVLEISESAGEPQLSIAGPEKRRGRPPGSRNTNVRAEYAKLVPSRNFTPAVNGGGIQKKRRGRPPGSRNKNVLAGGVSLVQPSNSTLAVTRQSVRKKKRGRPRGSVNRDTLSMMRQFFHRISKVPRQRRFRRCPQISSRIRD